MATVLKYGSKEAAVGTLQKSLNNSGPTRLPRLIADDNYGSLTMGRVMEFQSRKLLETDGAAGPITNAKLASTPASSPAPAGRCILVDLINERLRAFKDGALDLDIKPIKGGSTVDPSTRGVFKVFKRLRNHTSSKFPIPPGNMDFSLFYNGAEAIHQGPPTVVSHGCIHVGKPHASDLFDWAGGFDILVIVLKLKKV